MKVKGIAVNPLGQKQFVDHLAPLAIALDIPYLFHDELEALQAEYDYPNLKTLFLPHEEFSPEFLIAHFDYTLMSDQWNKKIFREKFRPLEEEYGKRMRNVHCPHGFSDKGFYLRGCAFEDICLVYGQNMIDLLTEWGVREHLEHFVTSGNIRFSYYQKHQAYYDSLVRKELLGHFAQKKPLILYAPTCLDLEESTSFFDAASKLLEALPSDYNMIVKPHPRLEQDDPAQYYTIISRYEDRENILFLKDFSPIYPLLSITDLYIGDMSSIGYDFLAFNRPMFFLNQQRRDPTYDRALYLFRCGVEIQPDQYENIYAIIDREIAQDQKTHAAVRRQTYNYTFAGTPSFEQLKEEIYHVLSLEN
ncbi:Uncharacterized protein PHSC3_000770 [Chlamydiales bacterium STE3]|nr:Uncharacterized protein PHSC3_000770 [Chlamydiales bacterium STE3]